MGWANCGIDSKGRPIGYAHAATCDHPGCKKKIDRGLAYACGGMHGTGEGCEGYFCSAHFRCVLVEDDNPMMCFACATEIEEEERLYGEKTPVAQATTAPQGATDIDTTQASAVATGISPPTNTNDGEGQ